MRILWIWNNKGDGFPYRDEKDGDSFQKHDEGMKKFRLAHPRMEITNSKDASTMDCRALVRIPKVKLPQNWQN